MNVHRRPLTIARQTAPASTHHLVRIPATVTAATVDATAIKVSVIVNLKDDSQVKNSIGKSLGIFDFSLRSGFKYIILAFPISFVTSKTIWLVRWKHILESFKKCCSKDSTLISIILSVYFIMCTVSNKMLFLTHQPLPTSRLVLYMYVCLCVFVWLTF